MKFYMKPSSMWGGKFVITDANDFACYRIDSKTGIGSSKIFIRDIDDNEIMRVEERGSFASRFDFYSEDLKTASMRKKKALFDRSYLIDEFGWKLSSDIWSSKFTLTDGARVIATWNSKGFFATGYVIDIVEGVHVPTVLSVVAAISKTVCDDTTTCSMAAII